jgi:hypothetical protein
MKNYEINYLKDSGLLSLYFIKDNIFLDAEYQRTGDIWNLEKRQLLIDSLINGFDIPKIYLHEYITPLKLKGKTYKYAVIDGKQRLKAIWLFIDDKFTLGEDITYLDNPEVGLKNLNYTSIANKFPEIKARFDAISLNVVLIRTNDVEIIEDMFSRLNEAAPLNAPEKRNAFGGPMPKEIRALAKHNFFSNCLPFKNVRYRYYDIAVKFLYLSSLDEFSDTKKIYLDEFVKVYKKKGTASAKKVSLKAKTILDAMCKVFKNKDPLLKSIGLLTIYYLLFKNMSEANKIKAINRDRLHEFEKIRRDNRQLAEEDITKAKWEYLEFDRLNQTPNDAVAVKFRYSVLNKYIEERAK